MQLKKKIFTGQDQRLNSVTLDPSLAYSEQYLDIGILARTHTTSPVRLGFLVCLVGARPLTSLRVGIAIQLVTKFHYLGRKVLPAKNHSNGNHGLMWTWIAFDLTPDWTEYHLNSL